jgi:hypothetical protein
LNKGVFRDDEHQDAFGTLVFTKDYLKHHLDIVGSALDITQWMNTVPIRYRRIAMVGVHVVFHDILDRTQVTKYSQPHAVQALHDWYTKHLWPDPWAQIYEEPDQDSNEEEE